MEQKQEFGLTYDDEVGCRRIEGRCGEKIRQYGRLMADEKHLANGPQRSRQMESTPVAEVSVNTVLLSETVFSNLPTAVRKLIAAYGTPVPSGNIDVFSFEVGAPEWEEIKAELVGSDLAASDPRAPFVLIPHYANDYHCEHDGAQWSGCNCDSVEPDNCPICDRSTEPFSSEQYIVIRHGPQAKSAAHLRSQQPPMSRR
jgi:hypothetical protein